MVQKGRGTFSNSVTGKEIRTMHAAYGGIVHALFWVQDHLAEEPMSNTDFIREFSLTRALLNPNEYRKYRCFGEFTEPGSNYL